MKTDLTWFKLTLKKEFIRAEHCNEEEVVKKGSGFIKSPFPSHFYGRHLPLIFEKPSISVEKPDIYIKKPSFLVEKPSFLSGKILFFN